MLFGLQPEQFDIAGSIAFLFVSIVAVVGLLNKNKIPKWLLTLLLLTGLAGLVIDLLIVLTYIF